MTNAQRGYGLLLIYFLAAMAVFSTAARHAAGAPLTDTATFCAAHKDVCNRGPVALMEVKGTTDNVGYILEADPTTGGLPITGTITATNPSVGATGAAVPASATFIAGKNAGNLVGFLVSAAGVLSVDGSAVTQPVSGTFWQATQPVSGTFWQATQPVSGTFWQATQPISAASLPLPTGAATETTLAAASAKLPAALGQTTMASSLSVSIASNQTAVPVSGTVAASNLPATADTNAGAASASTLRQVAAGRSLTTVLATYDYTGGTVTTAAYTQVVASTSAAITRIHIFDSSGSAIIIATGAALSEVDRIYLPPGGSGFPYEVTIPASTRIAIKALDTSASTGRMIITGLQ